MVDAICLLLLFWGLQHWITCSSVRRSSPWVAKSKLLSDCYKFLCGYQFSFLKLYFQRAFYYVAAVDGFLVDLAWSVVAHTWKNEETIKQIILYVCSQLLHFFGQQNNNNNNGSGNSSNVVIKIYHPKNQNFEPFPKGILSYIVTSLHHEIFFRHVWRNREETKYSAISHFTYHL